MGIGNPGLGQPCPLARIDDRNRLAADGRQAAVGLGQQQPQAGRAAFRPGRITEMLQAIH